MTEAEDVLAATLAAVPAADHGPLVGGEGTTPVPYSAVRQPDWLDEQVRLRGQRWGTDDRRVLATLWWYSASVWFQAPAVASLVATGRVLSPRVDDVSAHWLPDSRITGATSSAVLEGSTAEESAESFARALREVLEEVVPLVAAVGRMGERPLWAIASDSTANRFLWAGRAVRQVDRATELARLVASAVGSPLPRVRYVDVPPMDGDGNDRPELPEQRFTRRSSCCLLEEAPGQSKCGSCPRRHPDDRLLRLRFAASVQALEG